MSNQNKNNRWTLMNEKIESREQDDATIENK